MSCQIGRVTIVKNEGTIIFGNVSNTSPNNSSMADEGSTEGDTAEVSLDNSRFSLTLPIHPITTDAMKSKRKKKK